MRFEIEGDLKLQLDLFLNQGLNLFDNFELPVELGIDTQFNQVSLFWPAANVPGILINDGQGNLSWGLLVGLTVSLDHGALSGLADDDHTQYILEDGSRDFSGNISHDGNDITSVGALAGLLSDAAQTNVTSLGTLTSVAVSGLSSLTSISAAIVSKTGAYTATSSDHTILCGAGNETFTVTLPAASGVSGIIYNIKNLGTGTITVDGNASETIDGSTAVISTQFASITIHCDGSNWHII